METETAKYSKAVPGVQDALLELRKHYKLALISNSTYDEIIAMLKAIRLKPMIFQTIISKKTIENSSMLN